MSKQSHQNSLTRIGSAILGAMRSLEEGKVIEAYKTLQNVDNYIGTKQKELRNESS